MSDPIRFTDLDDAVLYMNDHPDTVLYWCPHGDFEVWDRWDMCPGDAIPMVKRTLKTWKFVDPFSFFNWLQFADVDGAVTEYKLRAYNNMVIPDYLTKTLRAYGRLD